MAAADAEAVGIWGGSARDHDAQFGSFLSFYLFLQNKMVIQKDKKKSISFLIFYIFVFREEKNKCESFSKLPCIFI